MPNDIELAVGDRVRLTEVGVSRCPKISIRTGVVVSLPRYDSGSGTVRVLFDGNREPTSIHRSYLELNDHK